MLQVRRDALRVSRDSREAVCMVHCARAYVRFARQGARRLYASETTVTEGGREKRAVSSGARTEAASLAPCQVFVQECQKLSWRTSS
eukprot:1856532-Prymnesium_polylepis.2